MIPGAAPAARSGRVAAWCCTALVLLLPALMALRAVGEPAAPGELARLERVVVGRSPDAQVDTSTSQLFHRAAVADASWPGDPAVQQALLVRARRAQVAVVAGLGALLYLAVMLAYGRLQALLACCVFALLPPVLDAGYVLRPETIGAFFALLSVVLMQVAASAPPALRGRRPAQASLLVCGLLACAAVAIGVTCEALPSLGESLLVPGVVLLLTAVETAMRARRMLARRGMIGTPIRAINRRLIPWTALGFLSPAVALFVMRRSYTVSVDQLSVTLPQSALLPGGPLAATAAVALLALGAVVMVVRLGARLGRGGRITAERVWLCYCAVYLLTSLGGDVARDPLPLAVPAAALVGAGAHALAALALGVLARRRRAGAT